MKHYYRSQNIPLSDVNPRQCSSNFDPLVKVMYLVLSIRSLIQLILVNNQGLRGQSKEFQRVFFCQNWFYCSIVTFNSDAPIALIRINSN